MSTKILIAFFTVVIVAGAVFLLSNKSKNRNEVAAPLPSPTVIREVTQQPTEATQSATVSVTESGYLPSTLKIKTGTKVMWVNKSGAIANVSSDPHPVHTAYPPLNLNNFNNGESVSLTFDKAGTYTYHNHLNPSQTGTVVVE